MSNLAFVQDQIQTVDFHGHELMLVAHNDEPYTPMRPIVEGMGLGWGSQRQKLVAAGARWGVTLIVTPSDGGEQKTVCMPLRKLPGWLASIHPSRVKPELREKIRLYQEECDDALWAYWTRGVAINPRIPLTPEHQRDLQELVAARAAELPESARASAYPKLWGAVKSRFRVGSYKDLPDSQYQEAKELIERLPLEGEWLGKEQPKSHEQRTADPEYLRAAKDFALDYFERCREAARTGGEMPVWDTDTEQKLADAICAEAIIGKRWLVSFDYHEGGLRMKPVQRSAMVLPVDSMAHLRDLIGECVAAEYLPELLEIGLRRLSLAASRRRKTGS